MGQISQTLKSTVNNLKGERRKNIKQKEIPLQFKYVNNNSIKGN